MSNLGKIIYYDKVYSSNFGSVDKYVFPKRQISISITTPTNFKGEKYTDLNPPQYLLDGYKSNTISWEQYIDIYYAEVLSKLDPEKVYEDLKGKVICCWCSKDSFCHRHLVMRWLRQKLGDKVAGGEL